MHVDVPTSIACTTLSMKYTQMQRGAHACSLLDTQHVLRTFAAVSALSTVVLTVTYYARERRVEALSDVLVALPSSWVYAFNVVVSLCAFGMNLILARRYLQSMSRIASCGIGFRLFLVCLSTIGLVLTLFITQRAWYDVHVVTAGVYFFSASFWCVLELCSNRSSGVVLAAALVLTIASVLLAAGQFLHKAPGRESHWALAAGELLFVTGHLAFISFMRWEV